MRRPIVFVLFGLFGLVYSRIHTLKLKRDNRRIFSIETFGFERGGKLSLDVRALQVSGVKSDPPLLGLTLRPSKSESAVLERIAEIEESGECLLEDGSGGETTLTLDPELAKQHAQFIVPDAGLYDLMFVRCAPVKSKVSAIIRASFSNPGGNYLSVGEAPLPAMYGCMCALFVLAGAAWLWWLWQHKEYQHVLHTMFTVLLALKVLSLMFEALMYHSINIHGKPRGWAVVYYIAVFCKALLLVTVVLLIATGWSLLKPFLSDRERQIFMFVLPLQVLVQIAVVVVDETAPGSKAYNTWRVLLMVADLVCWGFVLVPVSWSLRHLSSAAEADGKAREAVNRIERFRSFYTYVAIYLYVTRIVVYIMQATMGFRTVWLAALFGELASLVFYVVTGWMFRPDGGNPYVRVRSGSEDRTGDEDGEFGLEDGDEIDTAIGDIEDQGAAGASGGYGKGNGAGNGAGGGNGKKPQRSVVRGADDADGEGGGSGDRARGDHAGGAASAVVEGRGGGLAAVKLEAPMQAASVEMASKGNSK